MSHDQWLNLFVSGRWFDRVYPYWKHSLCSGSWGEHDPPKCTCCYGHSHLSTLPFLQVAHCFFGATLLPPNFSAHTPYKFCRPIVVPAGVELKISVSPDSRNTAWVSFDGRKRQELCHGDSLRVTTSIYPIPSICAQVSFFQRLDIFLMVLVAKLSFRTRSLTGLTPWQSAYTGM